MERPSPAPDEPTSDLVVSPPFDRVLAVVLFAVVGGVIWGVLAVVVVSWDAFKDFLVSLIGGGQVGGPGAAGTWAVCSAIALGVLGGAWFGWDITRASKRRRRPASRPAEALTPPVVPPDGPAPKADGP